LALAGTLSFLFTQDTSTIFSIFISQSDYL
jgi:hypothetical protein